MVHENRGSLAGAIRAAREQMGISPADMARQVGLTSEAYEDVEAYDREAFMTINVLQLASILSSLNISVDALSDARPRENLVEVESVEELVRRIVAAARSRSETVKDFGDRVGWDLSHVVNKPNRIWTEWNADCLRDVCVAIGVDWRSVLQIGVESAPAKTT